MTSTSSVASPSTPFQHFREDLVEGKDVQFVLKDPTVPLQRPRDESPLYDLTVDFFRNYFDWDNPVHVNALFPNNTVTPPNTPVDD